MQGQVKERPIIFSGEMVRAILDGKKTMTRRAVKGHVHQLEYGSAVVTNSTRKANIGKYCFGNKVRHQICDTALESQTCKYIKCPYGKVGDRLWVREAYTVTGWNCDDGSVYIKYLADGHEQYFDNETDEMECAIDSLVDSVCKELDKRKVPMLNDEAYDCSLDKNKPRNRSPMFMPRWASRILLEITDIRVERLNDISYLDARKEGVRTVIESVEPNRTGYRIFGKEEVFMDYKDAFLNLWDSLNTKKGYQWSSNPWVWVVEFKVVEVV